MNGSFRNKQLVHIDEASELNQLFQRFPDLERLCREKAELEIVKISCPHNSQQLTVRKRHGSVHYGPIDHNHFLPAEPKESGPAKPKKFKM